jgi:small subunit ribosomal protein S7
VSKRETLPDPKYSNITVTKFVNALMEGGNKAVTERVLYGALDIIREKTSEEPLKVFLQAMDNVKPVLEVKSRRVGGSTYQVPIEVRPDRRTSLAIRWIITYSRKRSGKNLASRLADELLDAFKNTGTSVKKKEDTHRMAEANRAFAHYRW